MEINEPMQPLDSLKIQQGLPSDSGFKTNSTVQHSKLYFLGKLVQTILYRPVSKVVTLSCRCVKLLTWDPLKAGLYKVLGYHRESAAFFEGEYLKTVKVVRDILFIPTVAKRACDDIVAKREQINDDIPRTHSRDYLKVDHKKKTDQYSSYLHGIGTFEVITPEGIEEFASTSDASLKTVMASHLFKPGMMAINFGTPNVATFVTEEGENGSTQTLKIDAKSLRRAEMTFHPTNGKIQSGIFLVPTNLPGGALERFKNAATEMQKRRDITCVNTNCRVLREAGFSIEAVKMDEVVFPGTLMEHLLFRNVYYTDSEGNKHKVHFDILNTTKDSLEDYLDKVDTAVVGTRLRHRRRNADTEEQQKARGEAAKMLIAQEKERLSRLQSENRDTDNSLIKRKVNVSVPSFIGDAVARIWGRHTIYELDLSDKQEEISSAFASFAEKGDEPAKLRPFPQKRPSLATRVKRDFFFSKPMIAFLRRHMMGRVDTLIMNTQDLFDHLKSTRGEHLNYVLLDDKVVFAKVHANGNLNVKHRKVADWALSKHALLAGRQEVYSSGEIWYNEAHHCFMINNDSGTYNPSKKRAQLAAKLANEIFQTERSKNVFKVADDTTSTK